MIKVVVSENLEVLAFILDGASTIVASEALTSVGVVVVVIFIYRWIGHR